ncbi:hypothetical protein TorRG33x02_083630 [Trema orientale]|uniref:Uncharacterized protein n=1 Tax=Trema orientale TaxID=63057 RepID=A0A2P5FDH1_TREOI|nr:hypothetical protein TorRG33x02_083630 [Trema orientale]
MESFWKKHMAYSYRYDRFRYRVFPPRCDYSSGGREQAKPKKKRPPRFEKKTHLSEANMQKSGRIEEQSLHETQFQWSLVSIYFYV